MNSKLRTLLKNCPSYFKKSAQFLSTKVNCRVSDVSNFRETKWYKENRKNYCS